MYRLLSSRLRLGEPAVLPCARGRGSTGGSGPQLRTAPAHERAATRWTRRVGRSSRGGVLGVRVDAIGVEQIHAFIDDVVANGDRVQILNVNVNCLNLAQTRPWLRRMLQEAPVVFCDGTGVQWAARLLGGPVPPRVPYNTWMWALGRFASERGLSFYFLGAKPGVAERAAKRLRERAPGLRVVRMHDGYFDASPASSENRSIVEEINASGADILLLGLGMPAQEEWLDRTWPDLHVRIALTRGASMDYLAGDLTTPPDWVARCGLEWLQRLAMEPRRLWRRYLIGNPVFFARVGRQWLAQRRRRSGGT